MEDPAPTDDRPDKSLSLAFRGGVLGAVAVGVVSGAMGVWPLFFAFPPAAIHLALSTLLGAALTSMLERHRTHPLPAAATVAIAGVLTFVIFAALPIYLYLHRSVWPAELLFR